MLDELTNSLRMLGFTAPAAEEIVARPPAPGCEPWCYGQGARRQPAQPLPADLGHVPTSADALKAIRYDYCSCSEGERRRDLHARAIRSVIVREVNREREQLWNAAGIPPALRAYTVESYLALPGSRPALVEKLRRWQTAAQRGASLIVHGAQGTAKTGLSAALVQERLEDGGEALMLVCDDWLGEIRATYGQGRSADDVLAGEWQMVQRAASVPLLLLDDVGELTEWGRGILFRLINRRDSWLLPTILTTNLDLGALEATLGKRTFDRLRGRACDPQTGETFVVELTGESRRGLAVVPS